MTFQNFGSLNNLPQISTMTEILLFQSLKRTSVSSHLRVCGVSHIKSKYFLLCIFPQSLWWRRWLVRDSIKWKQPSIFHYTRQRPYFYTSGTYVIITPQISILNLSVGFWSYRCMSFVIQSSYIGVSPRRSSLKITFC